MEAFAAKPEPHMVEEKIICLHKLSSDLYTWSVWHTYTHKVNKSMQVCFFLKLILPLALLLLTAIYLLFNYFMFHVCAYVPFPQSQCRVPEEKTVLKFLGILGDAWHHTKFTITQLVLTCNGGHRSVSQNQEGHPDFYCTVKWKSKLGVFERTQDVSYFLNSILPEVHAMFE